MSVVNCYYNIEFIVIESSNRTSTFITHSESIDKAEFCGLIPGHQVKLQDAIGQGT